MTWIRTRLGTPLCIGLYGLVVTTFTTAPLPAAGAEADEIARLAMSTASVMMMGEHEHEIEEALEKGDLAEALEEAEELVPWLKGAAWHPGLSEPVQMSTMALEALVARLKAQDRDGAQAAFAEVGKHFNHLHHELMEIVGEGPGH